jgi:hypothetical protein
MTVTRAFGSAAGDLAADFAHGDRPALVTLLLDACAPVPGGWWPRTVGERTAALLALLRATERRDTLPVTLRCPACGSPFEVELDHDALAALASAPAPAQVRLDRDGAGPLVLRLPTGEDLRAWRRLVPAPTPRDAVEPVLERLAVAGTPRMGDGPAAAAALAEADPLVAFGVACDCPSCAAAVEPGIDLEGLALRQLAARQHGLLHEVHTLASRYGWTEAEILAVPPARRARYLDLIEGFA